MLRWFVLLSVLGLLFAGSAFGQGFSVGFYYLPENGTPLTTVCQGGVPIADGYPIRIMWDRNNNGPDAGDTVAVLCLDPPVCEQGPAGTCNFNTMPFNGTSALGAAGYFAPDANFTSVGALPDPSRFYLRVFEPDGVTARWTTIVYTLAIGPAEIFIQQTDWTCGAGGAQCVVLDAQE